MENEIEYRITGISEIRELDSSPVITGYAVVFDTWSENLGGFVERFMPGFFAGVLTNDVRALWQHKPECILGRTTNGTLEFWEDKKGLAFRIRPPDTQWGRDAVTSIRRGDVNQMSVGFSVKKEAWDPPQNGLARRTLIEAKQFLDLSPVTFPAYPATTAEVRNKVAELRAQTPPTDEPAGDDRGRDANLRAWIELKSTEVSNE